MTLLLSFRVLFLVAAVVGHGSAAASRHNSSSLVRLQGPLRGSYRHVPDEDRYMHGNETLIPTERRLFWTQMELGACLRTRFHDFKNELISPLTRGWFTYQLENMVPCNLLPLQRTPLPSDNSLSKFSFVAPYSAMITTLEWLLNTIGCFLFMPELDLEVALGYIEAFLSDPARVSKGDNFLDYEPAGYVKGYSSEGENCGISESCDKNCCHIESDDGSGRVWYVPCTCHSENDCSCAAIDVETDPHNCIAKDATCTDNSDCCQYANKEMLCRKTLDGGILSETGVCEQADERPLGWNPFCVAWNKPEDSSEDFDTFGFTFAKPFPPFVIDPFVKKIPKFGTPLRNAFFPKMNYPKKWFGPSSTNVCEMHQGFKIVETSKFVVTLQLYGFALSTDNRLEFGSNKWTRAIPGKTTESIPRLWDGFLSIPFAPRPGFDFWYAFRLIVVPRPLWEYGKLTCSLPIDAKNPLDKGTKLALKMSVETYIDVGGGGAGTEPCVLVTIPAITLKLDFFQFEIGRGMGGWCQNNDAAEDACSPGGFFLNLEATFKPKGIFAATPFAALIYGLDFADEADSDDEFDYWAGGDLDKPIELSAASSFGVFLDSETNALKAVVMRMEGPSFSIFGIPVSVGSKFHVQYFVGSEMERRRESILRVSMNENCPRTVSGCESWKPYIHYAEDADGNRFDIYDGNAMVCEDKLLTELDYYNLVMTAQTEDPDDAGSGISVIKRMDGEADTYYANPRFDFRNAPDSDIFVLYANLASLNAILVVFEELSFTISYVDGAGETLPGVEGCEPPDDDSRNDTAVLECLASKNDCEPAYGEAFNATDVLDCLSEKLVETKRRDMLGYIYTDITVLFLLRVEGAVAIYNNPDQNEQFDEWTMHFFLKGRMGRLFGFEIDAKTKFVNRQDDDRRQRQLATNIPVNWDIDLAWELTGFGFLSDALNMLGKMFEGLLQGFSIFAEGIFGVVRDVINWIPDFVDDILRGLSQDYSLGFGDFSGGPGALIAGFIGSDFHNFGNALRAAGTSLSKIGAKVFRGTDAAVGSAVAAICDSIWLRNECGSCKVWNEYQRYTIDIPGDCTNTSTWHLTEMRHCPFFFNCQTKCKEFLSEHPDEDAWTEDDEATYYKTCWCMPDEYGCPVSVGMYRTCSKRRKASRLWKCGGKRCSEWERLPIEQDDNYPLFGSREYADLECRNDRESRINEATTLLDEMGQSLEDVAGILNDEIHGLYGSNETLNFTDSRSSGRFQINNVSLPEGQGGTFKSSSTYSGPVVSAHDSTAPSREQTKSHTFNLTHCSAVSEGSAAACEREMSASLKRAAVEQATEDLNLCNGLLDYSEAVLPPVASLESENSAFDLPCSQRLAEGIAVSARSALGNDDLGTSRRNRRHRRHMAGYVMENGLDIIAKDTMLDMIRNGAIPFKVVPGGVRDENGGNGTVVDPSAGLRDVLDGELSGELACMNPEAIQENLGRRRLSVSSYSLTANLVDVPLVLCDKMAWSFDVQAYDQTGMSNAVRLQMELALSMPALAHEPALSLQTRCPDSNITFEAMQGDYEMNSVFGVNAFRPTLGYEKCPHPFTDLTHADHLVDAGDPCQQRYGVVHRDWMFVNEECGIYDGHAFTQSITLGGLVVDDEPATPYFALLDHTYQLPNERDARVPTEVGDFLYPDMAEELDDDFFECGLCESLRYDHPQDFVCSEVGDNIVSVTAINGIGVSYAAQAMAKVEDNHPPNLITKPHTVTLNQYGWLDDADVATPEDLDGGTWDNCEIHRLEIDPANHIYQCGDEGPQSVLFLAADVNGNSAETVTTLIVDDSARTRVQDHSARQSAEGALYLVDVADENQIDMSIRKRLEDEFGFNSCKELGVYVRPEGESNFFQLDLSAVRLCPDGYVPKSNLDGEEGLVFTGEESYRLPCYDEFYPRSVAFHEALCNGTPLAERGPSPCFAEVKAEVMCKIMSPGSNGNGNIGNVQYHQTCYRINLASVDECPNDDSTAHSCGHKPRQNQKHCRKATGNNK